MNKGIRHATGKIVGIINSDDWYEMDAFATVADLYLKKGDLYLYHGDIRYCLGKQETRVDSPNLNLSDFYKGSCVFHPTVFVPLAVYRKVGVFDTAYKIAGDYDFLLRCYLNSIKFMYINRIIANMRITGISNRQRIMTYEEVKTIGLRYYRNKCKVHIAFFLNCFVYYLVCLKHCLYK
jgi:Glycosyl transferase family 2.